MSPLLRILALSEDQIAQTVFVKEKQEGGINAVFCPEAPEPSFVYQVFVHDRFPHKHNEAFEFPTFEAARSFAARFFADGWECLTWDMNLTRPCAKGDGSCGTCGSGDGGCSKKGGGCSSCSIPSD